MRIGIVGGGAFGAMSAVGLADRGHTVSLFERQRALMCGATGVGNRLHMGFHYPRHEATVRQCLAGYERFKKDFSAAILGDVKNSYFIAREGSLTSPDAFLKFCDRFGLPYRLVDPARLSDRVDNVAIGIETPETMFDPVVLRKLIASRLARSRITVSLGAEVVAVTPGQDRFTISTHDGRQHDFDAVVSCVYANANRLLDGLGHPLTTRQYEYTAIPIVRLGTAKLTSATIMDGPFFSVLPFGKAGDHLLFHVDRSVVAREDVPLVNPDWLNPESSPLASMNKDELFESIRSACEVFMPSLRAARLVGFVQGTRMVLEHVEDTDARPSFATLRQPGYVDVFAGKIVHCVWVADEVANLLS